ncbi:hypothetical protein Tco_0201529 [Tanacetum coccineum]
MDLETAQTTTTAKLPILKQENGNSFKPVAQTTTNADGTSTSLIPGPVTTEEKAQKKNDVKARSMLVMELPNEHLIRFGSNEATKKIWCAPSTESLDSIFNRLQKIVSQLAILGENISQEDLNLKFLRSLPSEWNTHVVVWKNKPDLDTMSFDDLYNNFKIVEQEEDDIEEIDLKWQLALLSMRMRRFFQKTSRKITINGSNTAGYDKSKVECFNCYKMRNFVRECRGPRNQDSRNRNQDSSRRTINVEETSSKAMVANDGASFDWSYMGDDEVPTNMALMAFSDSEIPDKSRKGMGFASYNAVPPPLTGLFSPLKIDLSNSILEEFQQPEFEGYGPKLSKSVSEDTSNKVRDALDAH